MEGEGGEAGEAVQAVGQVGQLVALQVQRREAGQGAYAVRQLGNGVVVEVDGPHRLPVPPDLPHAHASPATQRWERRCSSARNEQFKAPT